MLIALSINFFNWHLVGNKFKRNSHYFLSEKEHGLKKNMDFKVHFYQNSKDSDILNIYYLYIKFTIWNDSKYVCSTNRNERFL